MEKPLQKEEKSIQIEILQESDSEKVSGSEIKKIFQEALEIIQTYSPDWKPQESTTIVTFYTGAEQGSYVGKWNNKHHIVICVAGQQDVVNVDRRMKLTLRIAHELLHQTVAEKLKTDDINRFDIPKMLDRKVMVEKTEYQKAELITFCGGSHSSELQKLINEGFVLHEELKLCEALLHDPMFPQEKKAAVLAALEQRKTDLSLRNDAKRMDPYFDGYAFVASLLALFVDIPSSKLVSKINWQYCGEVLDNSEEFNNILHNPDLILSETELT